MKLTKIIALILAVLMTISSLVVLASCNKDEVRDSGNAEGKKEEKKNEDDNGDIFAERAAVDDELEDVDFGGRDFRVVTHMEDEIYIRDEDRNQGDLIVDAKFNRNKAVEDRFNVNIKVAFTGTYDEVSDYVSKTVLSGVDEFDLLMGMAVVTGGLVTKNLFLNWYDIENVDFSKPWWAKSCSDELTYDGKCILAVSDLNTYAITGAYCMIFNKQLAEAYDLGDIYGTVLDGKWTIDALNEMIKDVYLDDGNSVRDENDFYGFIQSHSMSTNAYLWAFDNPIMKKDEDGVPEITIKTDKINSIVTKIYDLFYNTNGVYFDKTSESGKSPVIDMFVSRKTIFTTASIGTPTGEKLRNFEDDYGLIPYPKFDENQKEYHTMADGFHTVLAVPKTCRDTEFVGTVTEALSAETYKKVIPTIYEIALKTRYLRDDESKQILDIIINSRVFDFGYIYGGWSGFSFMLQYMMEQGNYNFESYFASHYSGARATYKKVIKAYDKLK